MSGGGPPLRVLMVLEGWYDGGTEEYVDLLGRYLLRLGGIELTVALLKGARAGTLEGVREWATEVAVLGRGVPAALAPLRRLILSWRPDVCHCHLYSSLFPVTLLARQLRVPRVVVTLHVPLRQWSWRHRVMWRAAVRLSHRVVGVSRDVVLSLGRSPDPPWAYVIPAALPRCHPPAPGPAGDDAGPATGRRTFTVCGAGRLAAEKDWPTLFRAFAAFRADTAGGMPDGGGRLVLFGDGPLEGELRRLAATLGIADAVELRGRVPRRVLLSELPRMDLFVLPSRFEGLGIAAVEAMQQGVPTITADFGASLDFIEHGVTGHRFPRGDWGALAELMRWYYEHPRAARCIGRRGRESVLQRYSEENTFGLYPSIYADGTGP